MRPVEGEIFNIRPEVATRTYGLIRTRLKEDLQTLDLHRYINQIRAEQILLVYDEHDQTVKYTEILTFLHLYHLFSIIFLLYLFNFSLLL